MLNCEAREAGAFIAAMRRRSGRPESGVAACALLLGGETIVRLKGKGKGGRNQEMALAAAFGIKGLADTVVISVVSDGTDGPTDAAGGVVDGGTIGDLPTLARRGGAARDNDSYHALDAAAALSKRGRPEPT
jgi:hydroxypyruvate reductase